MRSFGIPRPYLEIIHPLDKDIFVSRKQDWKYLILPVVTLLIFSVAPEVSMLVLIIDVVGLDMILLLLEAQVLMLILGLYHQWLRPVLMNLNKQLEKMDPHYFIPSLDILKKYPPMIFHAVPFLVGMSFMLALNMSLYS